MNQVDFDVNHKGGGQENDKVTLIVVVGGEKVKVKGILDEPLESIIPEALEKAGVIGRKPEEWLIRDKDSVEYDRSKLIGDFNFSPETIIFLSLHAGEAG